MKIHILFFFFLLSLSIQAVDREALYNSLGAGNPLIPGYFADPTIKKFGDTYYLYSTTDGNGGGKGPSQVWVSKDFVNWTMMPMNWPTSLYYWAPDVLNNNNKYYLYYCQPSCEIFCGVSNTPRGPWTNIFGENNEKSLIPDRLVKGAITLDGQTFVDDDGSTYIYFGTWGIYEGFGCGVAKLSSDLQSVVEKRLIPNTEVKDFFEAPYMNKINGVYYFTYSSGSCHDDTYRVQYATSTVGPMGPFVYADNNPILSTTADRTIHGPGHHSILQEGNDYYIVYHRHNLPNSTRGMHRQIAVDKLAFSNNGRIEKVNAGHQGIGKLQPLTNEFPNLALGKRVIASSYYNDDFKPAYAVDDNNATLWRPKTCNSEWIEIDLGKEENIQRVWTQFEYPTSFYQYLLETSVDKNEWVVYSDKRANLLAGSPMVDYGVAKARYIRLTFTGSEKNGISAALWNIKVFGGSKIDPPQKIIDLSAMNLQDQTVENSFGMLGGELRKINGGICQREVDGRKAIVLEPNTVIRSNFVLPNCLSKVSEFTLSYKQFGTLRDVLQYGLLDSHRQLLQKSSLKDSGKKEWHQIAVCSDGKKTVFYLDGREVNQQGAFKENKAYFEICSENAEKIVADIRVYNWCQHIDEINFDAAGLRDSKPIVADSRKGLLVNINANSYQLGESVVELRNEQGINGRFTTEGTSLPIVLKNQRLAFEFDGDQWFHSDFGLPHTIEGNSPYSVSAWVMNSDLSDIECIVDLNQAGGELEKVIVGYGKDDKAGMIAHHAGYEDQGLKDMKGSHEWKHIVATYDGYKERIYIDGKMMKEKDIVLRLPLSNKFFIGKNFAGEHPFTGWLSSLALYDTPLTEAEVTQLYKKESYCNVLLDFQAANCVYDMNRWNNEALWTGYAKSIQDDVIADAAGKIVLKQTLLLDGIRPNVNEKIRSVVCEFLAVNKVTQLIAWDNFSIAYHPARKQIIIKNGNQLLKLTEASFPKKGWIHVVLLPEKKELYINSKKIDIPQLNTLPMPLSEVSISSANSFVSKVGIYVNELSAKQIESGTRRLKVDNQQKIAAHARAASANGVRLLIDNPQSGFQYYYQNETTGISSGWTKSVYYLDESVGMGQLYHYQVKAKDVCGNVYTCLDADVSLSANAFSYKENDYSTLINSNMGRFDTKTVNGQLEINSSNSSFKYDRVENEPYLYQTISGNFVMQVELVDFSGYANRKPIGLNEAGLMVASSEQNSKYWVMHLAAFPYWSAGNLLTYLTEHGRPQYANKKGWDLDRFMQVERCGKYFFFRTSVDGKTWVDMPNSPLQATGLDGEPVRVGLYQASNSANQAFAVFRNLKIWREIK